MNKVLENLKHFDIILVNTSAGKDSQVMMDSIVQAAKEQGVLDRVQAVHAIIEEEWDGTVELAQEQADHYGIPLHYVKRPQGSLLKQIKDRHNTLRAKGDVTTPAWPSNKARYCTSDQKRGQVSTLITKLVDEKRGHMGRGGNRQKSIRAKRVKVLNCLGIRKAESSARAKKSPFEISSTVKPNGKRRVWTYYPIFDFSLEQVWSTVKQSGVRYHYAYDLGMPRLSCCFCVFAPKDALILAGHHNKELLNKYVELEKEIGHTFRKELPIVQIQEAVNAGVQPKKIKSWDM